jgi:uncharacterized protein with PQ loop repeat
VRKGDEKFTVPVFIKKYLCGNRTLSTIHWAKRAFFIFTFAYAFPCILTAAVLTNVVPEGVSLVSFGATLGVIASLTTILMWIPQIMYTFRAKNEGSLSLLMLCIQFPGNLGAVYFQAIVERLGITTYGPYLCSAIEQFILIFMIIFFKIKQKRRKPKVSDTEADWSSFSEGDSEDQDSQDDEQPLLANKMADEFASHF